MRDDTAVHIERIHEIAEEETDIDISVDLDELIDALDRGFALVVAALAGAAATVAAAIAVGVIRGGR
jgi:hypothetical protein